MKMTGFLLAIAVFAGTSSMVFADHMSPIDIDAVDAQGMHEAAVEDKLDMALPTANTDRSGTDITETGTINAEEQGVDQSGFWNR